MWGRLFRRAGPAGPIVLLSAAWARGTRGRRRRATDVATSTSSFSACSLVGFWIGLDWLVLIYCERKTLLAGWFTLAETNQRTWCLLTWTVLPSDPRV